MIQNKKCNHEFEKEEVYDLDKFVCINCGEFKEDIDLEKTKNKIRKETLEEVLKLIEDSTDYFTIAQYDWLIKKIKEMMEK